MAGISSKAVLKTLSAYKYNGGSELEDEGGLDYYNTFYRKYDAQIGRFTGVDVMAESDAGLSPFHFGGNNPILFNDPLGNKKRQMREEDEDPGMKDLGNNLTINTRGMADFDNWFGQIEEEILEQRMNSGGGGGSSSQTADGFAFTGNQAQQVFTAFQNAVQNANADGEWSFSVGQQNGQIGYWTPFDAGSGAAAFGNTSGEVRMGTRFVTANQTIRPVSLTVGGTPTGVAYVWGYPDGDPNLLYEVPTYNLEVSGRDAQGNNLSTMFTVLRFGVKNSNGRVSVVGLQDRQSYTIRQWDPSYLVHSASSNDNGAWIIKGNFLIHDGPDQLPTESSGSFGTVGCIEICGANGFTNFNSTLLQYSGAATNSLLANSGMLNITYLPAIRPPLIRH